MDRWRAIRLIQDAYKKRIQDTLIDSLYSRVAVLEAERTFLYTSFNNEISAERQKTAVQKDLVNFESSLKEVAKQNAKHYKRQRNWLLGGCVAVAAYSIKRVLKPP
jgi:hypothetical protein